MRLHSPVLVTSDLERLRRFYTETLGLGVRDDFGACVVLSCGLSLWQPGPGHPVQPQISAGAGHGFELCFEADSVAEFERVSSAMTTSGARLLHPVREEAWGQRTLRVFDPDGHLLEWGESIPCFVRRLHGSGLDVAAVARRTGVAIDAVERMLRAD